MNNLGKNGSSPNIPSMTGLPQSPQTAQQLQQQQQQQQQEFLMRLRNNRLTTQQEAKAKTLSIIRIVVFVIVILIFAYIAGTIYEALFVTILLGPLLGLGLYFVPRRAFTWLSSTRGYKEFYKTALLRADTRSEPVLEKTSESGENHLLSYGFSAMQGWRRSMEDDHTLELLDEGGFFGIYDGHSGSGVANFCGVNMYDVVKNQSSFVEGNIKQALYDGFIAIDRELHAVQEAERERSGCTAVVLYVREEELFCANAGDSRCVLCRNGKAYPLSVDHKPYLPHEQSRIERAGGYVLYRRVNGVLALSRAIGDFNFKNNPAIPWDQQAVTSAPDVRSIRLNRDKDEFAIVACDGIWDVLSNEEVVDFVRLRIQMHMPLQQIAEALIDKCLSPQPFGLGCDNMSVVIVQFKRLPQRSSNAAVLSVPQSSLTSSLPTPTNEKLNKAVDMVGIATTKVESNTNMAHYDTPHAFVENYHTTFNSSPPSGGDTTQHVANDNIKERTDATNTATTTTTNNNKMENRNNDVYNTTVTNIRSSETTQANANDMMSSNTRNENKHVSNSNDGEEMRGDAIHPLANKGNAVYGQTTQMNNNNNHNSASNNEDNRNNETRNNHKNNNHNNQGNNTNSNSSDHRDSEPLQPSQIVSSEKNNTANMNETRPVPPQSVANGSQFGGNVTNSANMSNIGSNIGGSTATTTTTTTTTQRNLPRQVHTSIVSPEAITPPPLPHLIPTPTASSAASTLPIRSTLSSSSSSYKNELAEMNEHAHKQSSKQHKNDSNLYSLPQGITRSVNRTGANHSRSKQSRRKPSRAESPQSELDKLRSAVHNGLGKT